MAITKTLTVSPTNAGSHKAVTVTAVFTESSTNTANNTSTINFTLALTKNSWGTSFYHSENKIYATVTINGTSRNIPIPAYNNSWTWSGAKATIGGTTYTYNGGTNVAFPKSTSITYADSTKSNGQSAPPIGGSYLGSVSVTHDPDGTKTINVGLSITDNQGDTYTTGSASTTGTMTLTAIPRATQPSVSPTSAAAGSTVTISTPRASSSFTHTLKYKFGTTTTETQIATSVGTSYSWAIPSSIITAIPNATSGTCTIYCYTYNGSTLVGSKTTTFTITVPSSVVPTAPTISSVSEGNSSLSSKNFGVLIKNKSSASVTIGAGSGASGSTISSYGVTYSNPSSAGGDTGFASNTAAATAIGNIPLNTAGSWSVGTYCTDSRGRISSTSSSSFTVVDYTEPGINITSASSGRCNQSGTLVDDGTYFKVVGTCTKTNVNSKNTGTITIKWKEAGTATFPSGNIDTTSVAATTTSTSLSKVLGGGNIDTSKAYDVQITYTDNVGTTTTVNRTLASAFALMDLNDNGYAIAFGKMSSATGTNRLMEIDMPLEISGNTTFSGSVTAPTFTGDLDGNADTATTADVSTKSNITEDDFTGTTNQDNVYPVFVTATTTPNHHELLDSANLCLSRQRGIASTQQGYYLLGLGNNKADSVDGNMRGILRLWQPGSYWTNLQATAGTANYQIYLPAAGGTLQVATQLYNNTTGTQGKVTLSQTAANFDYLEIFYRYEGQGMTSQRVYAPNGKTARLTISYDNGTYLYIESKAYSISGTSMTVSSAARWRFASGTSADTRTDTKSSGSSIYVIRVVGYNGV